MNQVRLLQDKVVSVPPMFMSFYDLINVKFCSVAGASARPPGSSRTVPVVVRRGLAALSTSSTGSSSPSLSLQVRKKNGDIISVEFYLCQRPVGFRKAKFKKCRKLFLERTKWKTLV